MERIRSVVPAADLTLGGGTVLAARYNHRRSFDVDLWYPVLRAEKIYIGHGADVWTKHLGTMLSSDGTGANLFECNGIARGVEFSISASDAHNTAGTQPIAGHEVQAQMTQQILEGKILGRLCDAEAPVAIRDLYDIAIACRLEPESVRTVLQKARRDAKRQSYITGRLKRTPDDLHRADPKPVTEPRYRIEMHGLARRLIGLLESGDPLGGGPKATPLEFGAGATIAPQR